MNIKDIFKENKVRFSIICISIIIEILCATGVTYLMTPAFNYIKQNNLAESIDDAIDECIMVNHSIEKYLISHSNKQSTQSMSQEELLSFINLGKSTLLQDNLEKLSIENNYYENVKTKNIESLLTLNVTRYIPKFLSPTNRYVYLSVPLEKADSIKNNYRI